MLRAAERTQIPTSWAPLIGEKSATSTVTVAAAFARNAIAAYLCDKLPKMPKSIAVAARRSEPRSSASIFLGMHQALPISRTFSVKDNFARLAIGRLTKSPMRLSSTVNASRKAARFAVSEPVTAAGSGMPQ